MKGINEEGIKLKLHSILDSLASNSDSTESVSRLFVISLLLTRYEIKNYDTVTPPSNKRSFNSMCKNGHDKKYIQSLKNILEDKSFKKPEIPYKHVCKYKDCGKEYGTKSALVVHVKIKHKFSNCQNPNDKYNISLENKSPCFLNY